MEDIEQLLIELAGAIAQLPLKERTQVYFDLPEELSWIMDQEHQKEHDEIIEERQRQNQEHRVRRRQARREQRRDRRAGSE